MTARSGQLLALSLVALLGCDGAAAEEPTPAPPRADEFHSERLEQVLDTAGRMVRTRGFERSGEDARGFLVDRDSRVREVAMKAGTCYVMLGAASAALRELDLRVYDADGGEVAQDGQTGARAAVRYCPAQSGTYYLAVRASAGSGLYAVRKYAGPTGLDIRLDDVFPDAKERTVAP